MNPSKIIEITNSTEQEKKYEVFKLLCDDLSTTGLLDLVNIFENPRRTLIRCAFKLNEHRNEQEKEERKRKRKVRFEPASVVPKKHKPELGMNLEQEKSERKLKKRTCALFLFFGIKKESVYTHDTRNGMPINWFKHLNGYKLSYNNIMYHVYCDTGKKWNHIELSTGKHLNPDWVKNRLLGVRENINKYV